MRRSRAYIPALLLCLPGASLAQGDMPERHSCTAAEHATWEYRLEQALLANWERPKRTAGESCTVVIAQNFRGEVLNAGVEDCGDDPRFRKSVEDAAYRASPLPLPANDACFERVVRIRIVRRDAPVR